MGQVAPRSFPQPGELQATNEAPRVVAPVQPTPYIPNPGVRSLLSNYQTPAVAAPNSTNTATNTTNTSAQDRAWSALRNGGPGRIGRSFGLDPFAQDYNSY